MSVTTENHKKNVPQKLRFHVITVSTSKFNKQKRGSDPHDISGDLIHQLIEKNGHSVLGRTLINDDIKKVRDLVSSILNDSPLDVVILTGGTGITQSDVTIEAVTPLLDKILPGFGEIFRKISFEEIGAAALITRAIAGVAKGKALFSIPGSPNSVQIALEKLILSESPHIIKHAREK